MEKPMRNLAAVIAAIAVWFLVLFLIMVLLGRNGGGPEFLIAAVLSLVPAVWVGRRLWPRAGSEKPA